MTTETKRQLSEEDKGYLREQIERIRGDIEALEGELRNDGVAESDLTTLVSDIEVGASGLWDCLPSADD